MTPSIGTEKLRTLLSELSPEGQWMIGIKQGNIYGLIGIKEVVLNVRSLDKKTHNFLSFYFDLPKEEFRCYKHRQSIPQHFTLLNKLLTILALGDYSLAGRTALALQLGHRISVDLDFFRNLKISFEEIKMSIYELGDSKLLS